MQAWFAVVNLLQVVRIFQSAEWWIYDVCIEEITVMGSENYSVAPVRL